MKLLNTFTAAVLSLVLSQANAQTETTVIKKGTLVLADGSNLSGQVKDNIRKNASVSFTPDAGGKKKNYDGSDLVAAEIDGMKFICINGDFFKVFSEGDLNFLQKSSDASGKPSYNGNEKVFSSGTEGKPDDYFIYDSKSKQLKLVSKKNYTEVTAAAFANDTAALDKAKSINGDIAQLKDAVDIYNNRKSK